MSVQADMMQFATGADRLADRGQKLRRRFEQAGLRDYL